LDEQGAPSLHRRLAAIDAEAAAAILPTNGRRIVRALEVNALTGEAFTAELPDPRPVYDALQLGVDVDTTTLDERIATRVDAMWAAGWVDEVRALERVGLRDGRTAGRALGYQQILAFLSGNGSEDEARAATVQATRRFVRRQRSWFRRDGRIRWLDGASPNLVGAALAGMRQD
jgi:tRNA dimethylallyltransferase